MINKKKRCEPPDTLYYGFALLDYNHVYFSRRQTERPRWISTEKLYCRTHKWLNPKHNSSDKNSNIAARKDAENEPVGNNVQTKQTL